MDERFTAPPDAELLAHERTYHIFNMLVRWSMVLLATSISFLTLWFATPAGFLGGLAIGAVVFVTGYLGLIRHEAHQPLDLWKEGR
ncbi:hypothetical protein [Phenylobacterium sp.]|uniref:hypothetical protein n=1 Tax=Phenylobacterium sp. TaxID=1871053 RepID=UPI0035B08637